MSRRLLWACLTVCAVAGFLLRAVLAVLWPTLQRPDETFQNLEPAYRLLTGWGVVTWEWRDGIRSWLFPDFLYAIMRMARLLHLPLLPTVAVVLSAVATSGVIVAVLVGWRRYGALGAVVCGTLAATWPDLVHLGPKPLLEVQSGTLLFVAAGLASLDGARPRQRIAIGLLLGAAFDLRFQLAPALAVVAIGAIWRDIRGGWRPLVASICVPIFALGLVDWVTWGSPFQSIWKNIDINLFHDRSLIYGVEPIYWYSIELIRRYGIVSVPLALCFGLGVRMAPLFAITSVLVVAFHSLIAHKEISFIYAALPCAILVAGLGAARALTALPRVTSAPALALAALACAAVAAVAGQVAKSFREPSAARDIRPLWSLIRTRPDLCGLGLYGEIHFPWVFTPGYVGLERHVPIYLLQSPSALTIASPGFNYLVVDTGSVPALPDGERVTCSGNFCLLHRDQPCETVPGFDIGAVMQRAGQ